MHARNNPNPYVNITYVNNAEAERRRIRKEWIWYRKAMKVLRNKPKLRRQIEKEMKDLENYYEGIRQSTPPPRR